VDLPHGIQRAAVWPIGILFWLQVGLEYRFEHLHAVANTPAGPMETCSLIRFHRLRPSPRLRRVGPRIRLFEACSPFTHVTACMLAKSPMRPSTPKASATFVDLDGNTIRNCPGGPA